MDQEHTHATSLELHNPSSNVTRKRKIAATDNTHTEADGGACERCLKDGVACTRTKSRIRFSDVSGKVASERGSAGASGIQTSRANIPKKLVYIDETPELMVLHGADGNNVLDAPVAAIGNDTSHDAATPVRELATSPPFADNGELSSLDATGVSPENHPVEVRDWPRGRQEIESASIDSQESSYVMRGLVKPPQSSSITHNTLEFLLFRYYIDHLSTWLDFCDPDRHFQMVVPQRARRCPPLMNAILAASARHLTRVPKNRTASGAVQYDGRILHDLTDETALHYHNKCIHDLLTLGANPEQTRNEDLLAAGIILRFYEEVDYPLQDDKHDSELFLRVINIFIDAQIPNVPLSPRRNLSLTASTGTSPASEVDLTATTQIYSSPTMVPNAATYENKRWYMADLRQAAFWVAFRQEVYSAFLKQRPFNMSLSRCDVFRSFAPAEDALWTARLVIFCADVLEFCYGNSHQPPAHEVDGTSAKERWSHLKSLEQKWVDLLPPSFEPIYFRKPDKGKGEIFPEICYLTNLHIAGVQHVELARILLAVYDPNIPRLGLGHRAAMRALSEELRGCVLRLCGIAVHNRKNPPSLTTALLGIVVCGDHFEDRAEQQAILALLDELEYDLGWPSWGW
ncbi:hypothetical protein BJY01DRAFT_257699 [Aspergillus pseudoustus]|uniref:Fungal-specific transcription factor domain-containing protein n=1 Tax=Aspergillus pseudoustus TaxID=1810923 RepID=A0ABR4JII2_9EURO